MYTRNFESRFLSVIQCLLVLGESKLPYVGFFSGSLIATGFSGEPFWWSMNKGQMTSDVRGGHSAVE